MIRMLLLGYCFGIRSERRLCEEVRLNLAYRWFCRLSIEDEVPDHSTFSKTRHGRFRESDALRFVFEQVLERCIQAGLVGGEGFAIDASIVRADASRQRVFDAEKHTWPAPDEASRPVREYLEALDDELKPRKAVSRTDPIARWTAAPGGPAFFGYSTNYLVDVNAGIIVDVEPTPAYRTDEVNATKTMVNRVADRFEIKPERLIGDTAYGTAEMLGWMVEEQQITPHVPVWDKSDGKEGQFGRSDFIWHVEDDCYVCPAGKRLERNRRKFKKKRSGITKENTIIYRASNADCRACPLKDQCCPREPARKIHRSVHEDARDLARQLKDTAEYKQSRKDRKKVEMLFGHMKRILKLDRLRLRGLTGARDEFTLAATAQNLRRMAMQLGTGPPNQRVGACS
jgi:IS5 family transposase